MFVPPPTHLRAYGLETELSPTSTCRNVYDPGHSGTVGKPRAYGLETEQRPTSTCRRTVCPVMLTGDEFTLLLAEQAQKMVWHIVRISVDFFSDECDEDAVAECSAFYPQAPMSEEFDLKAFDVYCGCVS